MRLGRRRALLGVAIAVALLVAVLAVRSHAPSRPALTHAAVQEDPLAPTYAPPGFDVTVVVYSDYRCPHCRRLHPLLLELVRTDPRVRIVHRDWPVFGGTSVLAARIAIASQWQGRHAEVHDALMRAPAELDAAAVRDAAVAAGADWTRLEADLAARGAEIDALLGRTQFQAAALGLPGTPGVVVGPYVIPGAIGLGDLRRAVRAAREHPDGSAFER